MSHRKTKRGKKIAWKLDDHAWKKIEAIFPVKTVGPEGGCPAATNRRVFEALIWFTRNGMSLGRDAQKAVFPQALPSWSICRRRLIEWRNKAFSFPYTSIFSPCLMKKANYEWRKQGQILAKTNCKTGAVSRNTGPETVRS